MSKVLERVFSLDARSLTLFRIGLGLFTTADILFRLADLRAHYMDEGVMPRSAVTGEFSNHWHFSLHLVSDAMWWQLLLFAICGLAGLAMAAGYRTWTATLICWVLTVSIDNRNTAVTDGCDAVHRLLLFWSLFLRPGSRFNAGTVALTIQMASIYFFAALLKWGDPWRTNFDAVWYVLNWDLYATSVGVWLRQFHDLLRGATIATMLLEGVGPILLFVPWAPLRAAVVLGFIALHLSFIVAMKLFMFAMIMIVGCVALLPGWFWDKAGWPLKMSDATAGPRQRLAWVVAVACLLYVCCWNIRTVAPSFARVFPPRINALGYTLRIDQYWAMFAPAPAKDDGWFVMPGRLVDGRLVDVFRDAEPLTWERPALIADTYINQRWRLYLWHMTWAVPGYQKHFAAYLCRNWERRHDEALESFDIVLMYEEAKPGYIVTEPRKIVLVQGYKCT